MRTADELVRAYEHRFPISRADERKLSKKVKWGQVTNVPQTNIEVLLPRTLPTNGDLSRHLSGQTASNDVLRLKPDVSCKMTPQTDQEMKMRQSTHPKFKPNYRT